jgi:hypothetical protein
LVELETAFRKEKTMRTRISIFILLILVFVFLAGCEYYRVTDPSTGKIYYTKEVKKRGSGAVELKDEKTGNEVTLQNSEIQKIEKEAFNQGVYAK